MSGEHRPDADGIAVPSTFTSTLEHSDCFIVMAVGLFASILALVFVPSPARANPLP